MFLRIRSLPIPIPIFHTFQQDFPNYSHRVRYCYAVSAQCDSVSATAAHGRVSSFPPVVAVSSSLQTSLPALPWSHPPPPPGAPSAWRPLSALSPNHHSHPAATLGHSTGRVWLSEAIPVVIPGRQIGMLLYTDHNGTHSTLYLDTLINRTVHRYETRGSANVHAQYKSTQKVANSFLNTSLNYIIGIPSHPISIQAFNNQRYILDYSMAQC